MEDHRILCQVAGHNQDVVKLIPPLIIDASDVEWFLRAFESVMVSLHKPTATVGLLARLGKNTLFGARRDTSAPTEAAQP
jgi:ornithine--oxo-acid transaminase